MYITMALPNGVLPAAMRLPVWKLIMTIVKVYVYGQFNAKGTAGVVKDGALTGNTSAEGKGAKSFITFTNAAPDNIEFKYAISYVSAEPG